MGCELTFSFIYFLRTPTRHFTENKSKRPLKLTDPKWLTYAPVANHAAAYYDVAESTINWISTAFFLAFVFIFPVTIFVLHRSLKMAFLIAAGLILIGNWIRYAGSTSKDGGNIAYAMAGEIIIGFAQPFVLAAPTRYSDMWFTNRGRVAATAVMSLANPLGAALGQLIIPFWVSKPSDISNMVLRVSIMVRFSLHTSIGSMLCDCVDLWDLSLIVHRLRCAGSFHPGQPPDTRWTLL